MFNETDKQVLWEFIRGDMPAQTFEAWLYSTAHLENIVGNEAYLEIISVDFSNKSQVYLLKQKFEKMLREMAPLKCECISLANDDATEEGSERWKIVRATFDLIKAFGKSRWWLGLLQCNQCQQYWLYAEESRINDIDLFKRVDASVANKIIQHNEWPEHFQTFEELLMIQRKNNYPTFRFADPFANSLINTVIDLKSERENISAEEIAMLLNIDVEHARDLLKKI